MSCLRVAVLGGSRFIGRAIVERLLERGHRLVTVNRGVTPVDYRGEVERVTADRRDHAAFGAALKRFEADWVVDVSAYCAEDTRNAVDALRGRLRGFIHISSVSVYKWPFPCPVSEKWPLETDSANHYGFHKAECERVLYGTSGFPWTILRLPAVFGPCDPHSRERYLVDDLLQGRPVMIPESPFLCQNIFVEDAAEVVSRLIDCGGRSGGVYNAGGPAFALEDYVARLGRLVECEPLMIRATSETLGPKIDSSRLPYFFEGDLVMDTARLKSETGFEAGLFFDRDLFLTVGWILENPAETTWWGLPRERAAARRAFG